MPSQFKFIRSPDVAFPPSRSPPSSPPDYLEFSSPPFPFPPRESDAESSARWSDSSYPLYIDNSFPPATSSVASSPSFSESFSLSFNDPAELVNLFERLTGFLNKRNLVKPWWRLSAGSGRSKSCVGKVDGLTWYMDLGLHAFGEFSMAMIQANGVMEDQCQVESGPLSFIDPTLQGTFVSVYDGHGGPEASRFISDNFFPNLKMFASESQEISEVVIKKAFAETEEAFLTEVEKQWLSYPQMASVGSCCLTGVICNGLLYVANVGDSRAVLGRVERGRRRVRAVQLSVEQNANIESARQELWSQHPDDPNILVMKHRTWRVKGIIQVTRSIGDAYLKRAEFNREPLQFKFRLPEPFIKPILSAEPSVTIHQLNLEDEFLIFASDGLWEHINNQEAVDIVHNSPREGIARRLIKAALKEAAKKREMKYSQLKQIDAGVRRLFHDDITVVVIYLLILLICR